MKKIWIIEDYNDRAVAAPTWKEVIHAWVVEWNINGEFKAAWDDDTWTTKTLIQSYGEKWEAQLVALGALQFNELYDLDFRATQIPYYGD